MLELKEFDEVVEAVDKIFFFEPPEVTEEAEKVRTRLAVARTGRAEEGVLVGDCFEAFSASSSALALMYFRSQSRTPLRFLCAEQVSLVQGLDSVRSSKAMAKALPESSYTSWSYFGGWSNLGGGVARPQSREAMGMPLTK